MAKVREKACKQRLKGEESYEHHEVYVKRNPQGG